MPAIWENLEGHSEGKYLVIRRDGTIPLWDHFVIGALDPAAPEALKAYAMRGNGLNFDRAYLDSIWDLARKWQRERDEKIEAFKATVDPDAAPDPIRLRDNPIVIDMMQGKYDLNALVNHEQTAETIGRIAALYLKHEDPNVRALAAHCLTKPEESKDVKDS